ncbi:hypothetical protein [Paraliomyxa miuraensis]|nr:hypothetical protein [Paraliomyxa miuraensis]MCX4247855.1 hypothetical protein [Paraliomyxa miuraensis]
MREGVLLRLGDELREGALRLGDGDERLGDELLDGVERLGDGVERLGE